MDDFSDCLEGEDKGLERIEGVRHSEMLNLYHINHVITFITIFVVCLGEKLL